MWKRIVVPTCDISEDGCVHVTVRYTSLVIMHVNRQDESIQIDQRGLWCERSLGAEETTTVCFSRTRVENLSCKTFKDLQVQVHSGLMTLTSHRVAHRLWGAFFWTWSSSIKHDWFLVELHFSWHVSEWVNEWRHGEREREILPSLFIVLQY